MGRKRIRVSPDYRCGKHLKRVSTPHRVSGKQLILPWMFTFPWGSRITSGGYSGAEVLVWPCSVQDGVYWLTMGWLVIDHDGFNMDGFIMDCNNFCFMCWLLIHFSHFKGSFITISIAFVYPPAPLPHSSSSTGVLRRCVCKHISPFIGLVFIAPSTLLSSQWVLKCQWPYTVLFMGDAQ